MQTSHPSHKRGVSQAMLILGRLLATPDEWVPMIELYNISHSMAVHSRISDLRRMGYNIAHKNTRQRITGTIHSFYRAVTRTDLSESSVPSVVKPSESKSENSEIQIV